MSKDSFKVKKGLTLTPIDPADITNPQAGDLIADSTDDNKIKKYDATSSDWTSVGGSAGIGGNLMSEFEKLTPTVSNVTSATDTVTFLPIDDNNKSIKATWAGSVGSIQYQVALDSSLQEIQGTVSVWLRTSLSDIQISSVQDGVKISTLTVTGNNKWRQYEIPMVLGGSNVGFIVESLTAQTGDVFIDEVFVGLTPSSYAFDVAQSEFAFDVNIGGANISLFTSTSYAEIANSSLDMVVNKGSNLEIPCNLTNPSTGLTCSSGSESVGVVFDAQVGTYEICTDFTTQAPPSTLDAYAVFEMVETPNNAQTVLQRGKTRMVSGGNNPQANEQEFDPVRICGTFDFTTAGQKTVRLFHEKPVSSSYSILADRGPTQGDRDIHITGKYYPPKSTIVTQVQTLDVNTANEFNMYLSWNGASWDVTGDIDIFDSFSSQGADFWNMNFKSGVFTVPPAIECQQHRSGGAVAELEVYNNSTTGFTVQGRNYGAGGVSFNAASCSIRKLGADYNKSAMIVGNFEQIKSEDVAVFEGAGNVGQGVSSSINVPFISITDNKLAWDGDSFTAPQAGYYNIDGSMYISSNTALAMFSYINNIAVRQINSVITTNVHQFDTTVYLNEGDVWSVRPSAPVTLLNGSTYHYITIKKSPDAESLVKNLNDNKTVKCQTKYLSANTSSTGVKSDLTFSNLTVGKKYEVRFHHAMYWTATGQAVNQVQIANGSDNICNSLLGGQHNSGNGNFSVGCIDQFTASSTSLTFNLTATTTSGLIGNATTDATHATVCELPDYYIETDEW